MTDGSWWRAAPVPRLLGYVVDAVIETGVNTPEPTIEKDRKYVRYVMYIHWLKLFRLKSLLFVLWGQIYVFFIILQSAYNNSVSC